jgi:UDP-glucuronate 4-epimerase
MPPTRVLLTGSAGFIGQNVLNRLAHNADYHVWGLDLSNQYALLPHITDAHNVTLCVGDAGCTDLIRKHSIDVVIHLAGSADVRRSDEVPLTYVDNNVRVTMHLFEQARRQQQQHGGGVRIVYASSSSVYGDAAPPHVEGVSMVAPMSVYALSKGMCEDVAAYYHRRHGVSSIGLRPFTVYGPYGRTNMAVGAFAEAMDNNLPITVNGDGSQRRDYTYVGDVVDVIVAAVNTTAVVFDTFNVGAGESHSVLELADAISEAKGGRAHTTNHVAAHSADVQHTCACTDHVHTTLHTRPQTTLKQGLKSILK